MTSLACRTVVNNIHCEVTTGFDQGGFSRPSMVSGEVGAVPRPLMEYLRVENV